MIFLNVICHSSVANLNNFYFLKLYCPIFGTLSLPRDNLINYYRFLLLTVAPPNLICLFVILSCFYSFYISVTMGQISMKLGGCVGSFSAITMLCRNCVLSD